VILLKRDEILQADDAALSQLCELDFCRGSGPGGQKRNKSSSAARVRLIGTELCAEDCTERSQHRNRANALRKLKMAVAFAMREKFSPPSRNVCAISSPEYPLYVAKLFDALAENAWSVPGSAPQLGVTPTALLKILSRDAQLWQAFCARRAEAGLPALSPRK